MSDRSTFNTSLNARAEGVVIGENNTVTIVYSTGERRTIPFLVPPPARHELVGREEVLADLKQCLFSDKSSHRAVALYGIPGVGKTALTIALANDLEVLSQFRDGVLWAGLGNHANVLSHLGVWAEAVGIPRGEIAQLPSVEERAKAIKQAIGTRQMLLVVDDAWDIRSALSLYLNGPNCAYIVTTRVRKEVASHFHNVREVKELSPEDGFILFSQLAPDAAKRHENEVKELIEEVGALPLALILMGGYLRSNSEPVSQLDHAIEELRSDYKYHLTQPHGPTESSTNLPLEAVIGASAEALPDETKQTFYALSVFPPKPNSFSEQAALEVAGIKSAATLWNLHNYCLLESNQMNRYLMHPTITEYARRQFSDTMPYQRMTTYYVKFIQEAPHDEIDIELSNILAALHNAHKYEMLSELVIGTNRFAEYLDSHGSYNLAVELLEDAEQAAQSVGDLPGRATALLNLGRIAEKQGMYATAEKYLQEALQLSLQINDQQLKCRILRFLGVVAFNQGDYEEAEAHTQESLSIARSLHNEEEISSVLMRLGLIDMERGDDDTAEKHLAEGLDLARRRRAHEQVSSFQAKRALIAVNLLQYERADTYLREAKLLAQQVGSPQRVCACSLVQGILERTRRDYQAARISLEDSRHIAEHIEHRWYQTYILCELGEVHIQEGKFEDARTRFEKALNLAEQLGSLAFKALSLFGLARVAAADKSYDEARHKGQESLETLSGIRHRDAQKVQNWLDSLPQERSVNEPTC